METFHRVSNDSKIPISEQMRIVCVQFIWGNVCISWTQCLQNEVSLLRGFDVLWSVDGTFEDIPNARKSYSVADLSAAGAVNLGASFTTSACHCDTPVKFIRIVQTWNCESTTDAGGRWQFRLAELKLYGVSIK